MSKILLAVDGSEGAVRATRELIKTAQQFKQLPEVELLTVRQPLPIGGLSGLVVSREMVDRYYREEGEKALAESRRLLTEAGVPHAAHVLVGDVAQMICEHARNTGCEAIYMGTRGLGAVSNLVLGSVSTKVLHLAQVPVVLVP